MENNKWEIKIYIKGFIHSWRYHSDLSEILRWFRDNWENKYYFGGCSFVVFKNGRELTSGELYSLGFLR